MVAPVLLVVLNVKPVTAEVVGGPLTPSTEKLSVVWAAIALERMLLKLTRRVSVVVP